MLGQSFSSKLDYGSHITFIPKTASRNIGALIHSMKLLSLEVEQHHDKSTIPPCMEQCFHVWAGAPNYYLVVLNKLQK